MGQRGTRGIASVVGQLVGYVLAGSCRTDNPVSGAGSAHVVAEGELGDGSWRHGRRGRRAGGSKEQVVLRCAAVVFVRAPDLPLHLLHAHSGALHGLGFVVAVSEDPETHIEDAVEGEENHYHDHDRDHHLDRVKPLSSFRKRSFMTGLITWSQAHT